MHNVLALKELKLQLLGVLVVVTRLPRLHPVAVFQHWQSPNWQVIQSQINLGLPVALERTLSTTNPIENLNGSIRDVGRRVKRWRSGSMIKRWVAASILEAERGFHRVKGLKGMPTLIKALRNNAGRIEYLDQQQEAA